MVIRCTACVSSNMTLIKMIKDDVLVIGVLSR